MFGPCEMETHSVRVVNFIAFTNLHPRNPFHSPLALREYTRYHTHIHMSMLGAAGSLEVALM